MGIESSTLELRGAAFFPSAKRFRGIYGNVSSCYELESVVSFCSPWEGWVNFDWYSKNGRSIGLHDDTRVSIANGSFGIRYKYPCGGCYVPYLGIGPSFAGIHIKNKLCNHHTEEKSNFVVGGVVKAGVYWYFCNDWFIDFFVDYLYQPKHYETRVDLGAVKPGIGIGVKF